MYVRVEDSEPYNFTKRCQKKKKKCLHLGFHVHGRRTDDKTKRLNTEKNKKRTELKDILGTHATSIVTVETYASPLPL